MQTKNLNNIGQPLINLKGEPLSIAVINFELCDDKGLPVGTTFTVTGEAISKLNQSTSTDINGEFSIDLVPNDLMADKRYYKVTTSSSQFYIFVQSTADSLLSTAKALYKAGKGLPGVQLLQGESAYEIALENGFIGTEAEWLASLKASIPTSVWTSQEW